jgi:hypothetical protein
VRLQLSSIFASVIFRRNLFVGLIITSVDWCLDGQPLIVLGCRFNLPGLGMAATLDKCCHQSPGRSFVRVEIKLLSQIAGIAFGDMAAKRQRIISTTEADSPVRIDSPSQSELASE